MIVLEEVERSQPLAEALSRIPQDLAPVLLDSSDGSGWSMLAWAPDRVISGVVEPQPKPRGECQTNSWPLAQENPAALLQKATKGESWSCDADLPMFGGWLGWFGFACGHAFEAFPWVAQEPLGFPDYHFGRYRRCVVQNPEGRVWLLWGASKETVDGPVASAVDEAIQKPGGDESSSEVAQVRKQFHEWGFCGTPGRPERCDFAPTKIQANVEPLAFQEGVSTLRAWIGQGELFQANYSHCMTGAAPDDARQFYQHLRAQQPVAFSAYWEDAHGRALLSCSPELFLAIDGDTLETRPIKGTAPRGDSPESDAIALECLQHSEKEIAELTMIVDMARNDLGRIASLGGVRVVSAGEVEAFSTLFHRTARIQAQWDSSQGLAALMRATFPPASVTGAPKVRALQAIAELEKQNRGPYCGALGYWLPGAKPRGAFSVLIRTALIADQRLALRVGAGIVWDSDPKSEWEETLLKARYLTKQ
jgi:para-aminobenzoate synthetase component 1